LSSLYLIRHGQAGLRHNYDTLSDLGRHQARLLGEYLAHQNVSFSAIYSGALNRQQETAREVLAVMAQAGIETPGIEIDTRWNEFDLDMVYESIAPPLREADPEFRTEHDKLLAMLAENNSPAHRSWTLCDTLMVRAWVEGQYEVTGESWKDFTARVAGWREMLGRFRSGETVAVFSSATPVAVWVGLALGLNGGHVMRLAGVTYNSALTTIRVRDGELALYTFNGTPHLNEPHLRTFR
jgi:broad specificity phosphatase PhoE